MSTAFKAVVIFFKQDCSWRQCKTEWQNYKMWRMWHHLWSILQNPSTCVEAEENTPNLSQSQAVSQDMNLEPSKCKKRKLIKLKLSRVKQKILSHASCFVYNVFFKFW